jgi:hypothetical protein
MPHVRLVVLLVLTAVQHLHRRRRQPGDAHHPELGVVPAEHLGVAGRGALVPGSHRGTVGQGPCTEHHSWRAVTTIVLGGPHDPYPGDQAVEAKTRDFCSRSVGAWLDYPVDYDFGYSWFHQAEWNAGNRRSVCWARTDQ